MTKLRNIIVRSFIIVVFVVQVIDSMIDSGWDSLIAPELYPNGEYAGIYDFGTVSYLVASILLYVMSAIVFYKIVKKAIEKESNRQVKEQNLVIADSGLEIAETMKVFEPFVTENEARTVGKGTGLGLAITKRILDQHNARIAVSSEIEGYTKGFVVDFK